MMLMSIALAALLIGNYRLESQVSNANEVIHTRDAEIVGLENELGIMKLTNEIELTASAKAVKVIENRVVEIKKVYVPQIEYIDRYVGDSNETDCQRADGLLNSVVY